LYEGTGSGSDIKTEHLSKESVVLAFAHLSRDPDIGYEAGIFRQYRFVEGEYASQ
jgi:hypothetical protein